jgi:hypothetical protein
MVVVLDGPMDMGIAQIAPAFIHKLTPVYKFMENFGNQKITQKIQIAIGMKRARKTSTASERYQFSSRALIVFPHVYRCVKSLTKSALYPHQFQNPRFSTIAGTGTYQDFPQDCSHQ